MVPQPRWRPYSAPRQADGSRHRVWRREASATRPPASTAPPVGSLHAQAGLSRAGANPFWAALCSGSPAGPWGSAVPAPLAAPATRGDGDLTVTEERVSLLCPVTLAPLRVPARGAGCQHRSCCEAEALRWLISVRAQPTCPICGLGLSAGSVREDKVLALILRRAAHEGVDVRTHRVAIVANGAARFVDGGDGAPAAGGKAARQQGAGGASGGACAEVIDLDADDSDAEEEEPARADEPLGELTAALSPSAAAFPGECGSFVDAPALSRREQRRRQRRERQRGRTRRCPPAAGAPPPHAQAQPQGQGDDGAAYQPYYYYYYSSD